MKLKTLTPWKESYDQPRQHIKKQRHYCANKGLSSQGYVFSSGHVWMWELDCEESWAPKNWCFWTVVLEKAPESPLDCKEIQPVHSKGDQSWCSLEGLMLKLKLQYFGHLSCEDPDAGKDWGQEEKRKTEDDDWMASLTWWTWVWASSGRWWRTGKPGVQQSMGSQRVELDWVIELNWTEYDKSHGCASLFSRVLNFTV